MKHLLNSPIIHCVWVYETEWAEGEGIIEMSEALRLRNQAVLSSDGNKASSNRTHPLSIQELSVYVFNIPLYFCSVCR